MIRDVDIPILRNKKVVIDTNVFLLLVVGSINPLLINKTKLIDKWSNEEYNVLATMIEQANVVLLQPGLVECSNLLGKMRGFHDQLEMLVASFKERYRPSKELIKCIGYNRYGIADA